jgi:hypothetical protein
MRRWNDNSIRASLDSIRTINLNDYYYTKICLSILTGLAGSDVGSLSCRLK